jgi:hypothetical protein
MLEFGFHALVSPTLEFELLFISQHRCRFGIRQEKATLFL